MVEFILGVFIIVLIRNKIVININSKARKELYSVYHFKRLFKSWEIYLPLIMMCAYIYLESCVFRRDYWFIPYQQQFKTLTLLSYLPLIFKYKLYESAWSKLKQKNDFINIITSPMVIGTTFITLGTILNLIAIKANNGMPVFPNLTYFTGYATIESLNDGLHMLGNMNTKLIPLTDIWDIGYSVMSIGDVFNRLYVSFIIYFSIKKSNLILI